MLKFLDWVGNTYGELVSAVAVCIIILSVFVAIVYSAVITNGYFFLLAPLFPAHLYLKYRKDMGGESDD